MIKGYPNQLLIPFAIFACFACCVTSALVASSCVSTWMPEFDGLKVSDFPLATYQGLAFDFECTRRCRWSNKCRSYMFNSMTGLCSTFAVGYSGVASTFNPTTAEAGSKLYTACGGVVTYFGARCISDADCVYINATCSLQRCVCADGYSFDPSTGDCVVRCCEYGDFGTAVIGKGIHGLNKFSANLGSLEACKASCKIQTSFTCVNIQYYTSGMCHMHEVAWHELSESVKDQDAQGWVLYHRNCKV